MGREGDMVKGMGGEEQGGLVKRMGCKEERLSAM